MQTLFISLLVITVATVAGPSACLAQKPDYEVAILADGKPLELNQGIPISTQAIELTGQLTPKSRQQYSRLKPDVLIHKAIYTLVRESRRISYIDWPSKASIADLFKDAKVGDRLVIQFEDVELQTNRGQTQRIDTSKLVQLTVSE